MGNAKLYVEWDALGKAPALVRIQNPATGWTCETRDRGGLVLREPAATVVLVGKQDFPGGSNA